MTRSRFLKMVTTEVNKLRKKLTKEQKKLILLNTFNHNSESKCLYGLLTGRYDSSAAHRMYPKKFSVLTSRCFTWRSITLFENHNLTRGNYCTGLEKWFYMVDKKQRKDVLRYIKGTSDVLNLTIK